MKIIVVTTTPPRNRMDPPLQIWFRCQVVNFVMMSHMHQGDTKRFMAHIMRLSGESRTASQAGLEWVERAEKGR